MVVNFASLILLKPLQYLRELFLRASRISLSLSWNIMKFVRVWVSTVWIWWCVGHFCQVLAKKGENGADHHMSILFIQMLCEDVRQDVSTSFLDLSFLQILLCLVIWVMNTVMSCVLSYPGWCLVAKGNVSVFFLSSSYALKEKDSFLRDKYRFLG